MRNSHLELIRKFIPLIAIIGCMGGITVSAMEWAGSPIGYFSEGLLVLAYAVAGTVVGMLVINFFRNKGKNIIKANFRGEAFLVKQPIFLLAVFAVIFALLTNKGLSPFATVMIAVLYGLIFILGIANGIFDYRNVVSKKILFAAVLPIGLSFLYGYYLGGTDDSIEVAWFFGSLYLLSYLLFINRIQLNSILFFKKSVNIEDSRKIRVFNDRLVILFYIAYLILFNIRKLLNVTYDGILAVIGWLMVIAEKIMEFLLAPTGGKQVIEEIEKEELKVLPKVERPWLALLLKIFMYVVVGGMAIAAIISIIIIIIKMIKKIKERFSNGYNLRINRRKVESKEYKEESEIVRETENKDKFRVKRKKMQYNLKKLNRIPLAGEKIRYVYGFVLERLYNKKIAIEESDTPEEILQKIKSYKNGEKLVKMGFEEFTENYRKARYSDREMDFDENLLETADRFEKGISSIHVESKSRFEVD